MQERISFLASSKFFHYLFRVRSIPALIVMKKRRVVFFLRFIAGNNRKILAVCYDIKNVLQATTIRNEV